MGKGGGQAQTQTTIQDVPSWAKPYYEDILQKSKAASEQPYVPYGGQRVAQPGQDVTASEQMIRGIAGAPTPGVGQAMGILGVLGQQAGALGVQQPAAYGEAQFSAANVTPYAGFQAGTATPFGGFAAYTPQRFTGFEERGGQQFQFAPERQFTGQEVQQYMSPYMQNVVERQQEDAIRQFQRQGAARAAQAVQAGAFGGSRQGVQEALAEEALGRQLGDIQATGLQSAYQQAASQFEADRAAQMSLQQQRAAEAARVQGMGAEEAARVQQARAAEEARIQSMSADEFSRLQQSQAAELARVQGIGLEEAARVQQAQAAELARTQNISVEEAARIQAGRASEAARVQAARADEAMRQREFQLQTMGFSAEQARGIADLGERARAGDIQAAQLLEAQGLGSMAREQAGLDVAYQDFLRQQGYPISQLGAYSQFIRGLPVADAGSATTYQAQPSPMQQALGAGISAYGLYRGLQ